MDALGDRMKFYEGFETQRRCMPLLPICARLDGRAFHSYTRGMNRPYDTGMIELMQNVTKYMVEETGALIGYTQSDEISLILYSDNYQTQIFFDGKIQKLVSILASMASVKFNYLASAEKFAQFDCRVWSVPNKIEATNVLLWRELDATKNSISMAAQSVFSHKQLHGKNSSEMQDMLMSRGINWNDYPSCFKRGTYYQRRKTIRKFTTPEIEKLPKKHEARNNPNLMIERTDICNIDMPPMSKIINRVNVVFDGDEPVII